MKRRFVSIATAVILASIVAVWVVRQWGGNPATAALSQRELATQVLAEHVAKRFAGKRALVISNPFTRTRDSKPQVVEFEEAGIRGLKNGFGKAVEVKVGYPALRPEFVQNPGAISVDPNTTTPLSFLVAEDAFDRLAEESSDCEVLVSLIGLPVNLNRVRVWQAASDRKFALLLPDWRLMGNRDSIRAAFKSGKLVAAVINKPGAPAERERVSGRGRAAFDQWFLLATAENIDELLAQYPHLF